MKFNVCNIACFEIFSFHPFRSTPEGSKAINVIGWHHSTTNIVDPTLICALTTIFYYSLLPVPLSFLEA